METNGIIDELGVYEEKIGELYFVYADIMPKYALFWKAMAREQQERAAVIYRLKWLVEKRLLTYRHAGLNELLIGDAITRVDEEKERAAAGKVRKKEAFSFALELDLGAVTQKFLDVFRDPKGLLKHTFALLKEDAIKHSEKLREMCFRYKADYNSKL